MILQLQLEVIKLVAVLLPPLDENSLLQTSLGARTQETATSVPSNVNICQHTMEQRK